MSIVGHGVDLVECSRIADVWKRHGQRFLDRVLTEAEQERCKEYKKPIPFISGRWAAKEAVLKMIGTGWRGQISWKDIEVLPNKLGQPIVELTGESARLAEMMGIKRVLLSITHTEQQAFASAIGIADGDDPARASTS